MVEEYELKKNSGPGEKDHYRHKFMEYALEYLKTFGSVVKSYDVPEGPNTWSKHKRTRMEQRVLERDIPPCLSFSMNKKQRWELEGDFGVDMLGELRDLHDDMDVVILQRVYIGRFPVSCFRAMRWLEYSKIEKIHCLETFADERPKYHVRNATGRGQSFPSIIPKKTVEDDQNVPINAGKVTIAYNFMKPPENYMNFDRKRYNSHYYRSPRVRFNARIEWKKIELKKIQHKEFLDEFDDFFSDDDVEYTQIAQDQEVEVPSKFYDFGELLVEKFVFVNLKKSKSKK